MDTQEQLRILNAEQMRAHSLTGTGTYHPKVKTVKTSPKHEFGFSYTPKENEGNQERTQPKAISTEKIGRLFKSKTVRYILLFAVLYGYAHYDDIYNYIIAIPSNVMESVVAFLPSEEPQQPAIKNSDETQQPVIKNSDETQQPVIKNNDETENTGMKNEPPKQGSVITSFKENFQKNVQKNVQSPEAWIELGNEYYSKEMPKEAIDAYTRALEITPKNVAVINDRGNMFRKLKKYDLALASYALALQIEPNNENALLNAGIVLHFDLNRSDEALKKWKELLRINPEAKTIDGTALKDIVQNL